VRGRQHCAAIFEVSLDKPPKTLGAVGIEGIQRLVEQPQGRSGGGDAREAGPLELAR
jgi:hypothetical protein